MSDAGTVDMARAITGAQVRMARAALGWSLAEMAKQARVGLSTVQLVEAADDPADVAGAGLETTRAYRESARAESVAKIAAALEGAGITFLVDDGKRGPGVRYRAT